MSKTGLKIRLLDLVYDLRQSLKNSEITLAYEGEINQEIIKAFASLAENNFSKNNGPEFLRKKVYHVMVECLQNISRHASDHEITNNTEYYLNRGVVLVYRNHNEYHITAGNIINKPAKTYLEDLLNNINSLSIEDLNQLYKDKLKDGQISDKGGAGLGFIDIRRKTGSELRFQFQPVSENHEFFLFSTIIPGKV